MLEELVPPRQAVLVRAPVVEGRPDSGGGPDRPQVLDGRENPRHGLQEVVDLVAQHRHVVEVAEVVVIGRAQERDPAVGHEQDVAAVDGLG